MLPRSCLRWAVSKSNSSTRLPRTTTTRVSSGWVASINILFWIFEILSAGGGMGGGAAGGLCGGGGGPGAHGAVPGGDGAQRIGGGGERESQKRRAAREPVPGRSVRRTERR